LRWDFAGNHHSPRNIAVGNHADRFQILCAFDYCYFAAVVSDLISAACRTVCSGVQQARFAIMMSLPFIESRTFVIFP